MATFDSNTWYWITQYRMNTTGSLKDIGFLPVTGGFSTSDVSTADRWQIFPLDDGSYQLRCQIDGVAWQLATCYTPDEIDSSRTRPCMQHSSVQNSQRWRILPWGDGSFYMENVANGSSYHMDCRPGNPTFMSSDLDTANLAQHWVFSSLGSINDRGYSTAYTLAGEAKTTAKPSSTSAAPSVSATTTSSSSSQETSSSLSSSSSETSSGLSSQPSAESIEIANSTSSLSSSTLELVPPSTSTLQSSSLSSPSVFSPPTSSETSPTTKIAIGVGVGLGAIIFLLLAMLLILRRKKRAADMKARMYEQGPYYAAAHIHEAPYSEIIELHSPSNEIRHELPFNEKTIIHELHTSMPEIPPLAALRDPEKSMNEAGWPNK